MPELPEVETVRRGLAPTLVGARFVAVEARRGDLRTPFPPRFAERLKGRRVLSLKRRAKYLLAGLDGGETLVMHLGMSGSFRIERGDKIVVPPFHNERPKLAAHDHVVFDLDNGARVIFNDPRRFGSMDLVEERRDRSAAAVRRDRRRAAVGGIRRDQARRTVRRRARADQDRAARPEAHRGLGQHLCLRSAAPRADQADPSGGRAGRRQGSSRRRKRARSPRRSARCWRRRSKRAARRCATTASPMASSAISSIRSPSTTAKAPPARARGAMGRSRASFRAGGRRSIVRRARSEGENAARTGSRRDG